MANSKVDFSGLTPYIPEAVNELASLIVKKTFKAGTTLEQYVNIVSGITHRMKVGYLSAMTDVGMSGSTSGCTFNEMAASIATSEEEWIPQPWNFQLGLCSDDVANTVGAQALKKGVNIHDMSNTEIFDLFIAGLEESIMAMYLRWVWIGNKNAANWSDSPAGVITDGIDVDLINVCDGLWEKAFDIIAATPAQRVTVAANDATTYTTYAAQKAAMTKELALSYIQEMIENAPEAIQQELYNGNYQVHVNQKWFNKLKRNFQGTGLESMLVNLQNGVVGLDIDGITVVPRPDWDYLINKYENSGTMWNKPFRALLYEKANALVGVPDVATWGQFDSYYWKKDHKMYIDMKDMIDTRWMYSNAIMVGI